MYKGSNNFENAMDKLGGRTFRPRIMLQDGSILNDVINVVWYGGSNMSDDVAIGTTIMSTIEISVNTDKVIESDEITLDIGVLTTDGQYEYAPMGKYIIQKTARNGINLTIKAADRMCRLKRLYASNMTYPAAADDVIFEIAELCGIKISSVPLNSVIVDTKPAGYTCKEIIGYIAARLGKFACFNRYGQLEFRWYSDDIILKSSDVAYKFEHNNKFTIESITFRKNAETSYTYGSGKGVDNSNPLCQESDAAVVYNQIGNYSYDVAEIEILGDIRLDPWDVLQFEYLDGKLYKIPCMNVKHVITGGCKTIVESVGKSEIEDNGYEGPVTRALERTYTDLLTVNRILSNKVETEEFNAVTAKIGTLDNNLANINKIMFGSATGTELVTEFANAIIAVLGTAQIKSSQILNLDAGKINSGVINTALANIVSEDGRLSIVGNNIILTDINDVVRVKIGYINDIDGYDFNLFDNEGNLMFSAAGIEESAIKQAIINNESIKKDANISAAKLDIASLFDVINNDGTHTLRSSKIYLDEKKQSLEVAFNTLSEQADMTDTNLSNYQNAIQMTLEDIQDEIDGVIETYTDVYEPTLSNAPASAWNTTELRQKHIGDLFYNTNTGYQYRFLREGATWKWQQIKDTDITKALQDAENAQEIANIKKRVFVVQPIPPYDIGDLWSNGTDLYRCKTAKAQGTTYSFNDWEKATGYTDDSKANEVDSKVNKLSNTVTAQGTDLSVLQGQINSKIWQTDINTAVSPLGSNITTLNTKYSELTQDLSGFKTTVSSTYTTKQELNNLEIGSRNLIRYNNVVQYGSGTLDKSNLISAGEIVRDEAVMNGGFQFDSKDCYEPNTDYVLSGYITVLDGTLTNFRIVNGKGISRFISFEVDRVKHGNPFVANFTEINDLLNDKNPHYFVLKYRTPNIIPEDTGLQYTYFQPNSSEATAIKYKVEKFNLQKGTKPTDWTPAPEDVQQQFSSVRTVATQTADKFNWLVADGTSATDFTLTNRVASLLSAQFNIDALTMFKNSAESGTSTVINGGAIKANSINADKINLNDLFAQTIVATGLIQGLRIIAGAGSKIGGFDIWDDSLNNGIPLTNTKDNNSTGMGKQGGNWAFWAGNGRYLVDQNGNVHMDNLTATGGKIGNVGIDSAGLVTGNVALKNGMITISNISIPDKSDINKVQIDSAGFRFIDKYGEVERTCVWNYIYKLY